MIALNVVPDKSISHRLAIIAAVSQGESVIENFSQATDCLSTLRCLQQLGVQLTLSPTGTLTVEGRGFAGLQTPEQPLDAGNSGTTVRLLSGLLAGSSVRATFTGDKSLLARPMRRITEPLRQMGATISADHLPFTLHGSNNLKAIEWDNTHLSAQVKSALLLAGSQAHGTTIIHEKSPTRNHLETALQDLGVPLTSLSGSVAITGPASWPALQAAIPGDISAAAFLWVAALLLQKEITITKVGINPTRTGILDVLQQMGVQVTYTNRSFLHGEPIADVTVQSPPKLYPATIVGALIPRLIDEIPIIALLATQATGTTIIRDATECRAKEADRLTGTAAILQAIGAAVTVTADGLIIDGPTELHLADAAVLGDHRLAMVMAVAIAAITKKMVKVNEEVIAISFPDFYEKLSKILTK